MNILQDITGPPEKEHTLSAKRAVFLFVAFIALQFVFGFLFYTALGVYSGAAVELGYMEYSAVPEFIAPFDLPIQIISLILSALFIVRMTRRTLPGPVAKGALKSIGWSPSSSSSVLLACCIGAAVAVVYLFILVPAAPPAQDQQQGPLASAAMAGGWQRFYWTILVLLIAPPIEEYIFRGILFTGLFNAFGAYIAAPVVTFLFVIMHMSEALNFWPAWIGIFSLAVVTIILRIRMRSLLPAIAAHFSYNLVIVATVYATGF